jgi:hypothetical protein
MTTFVSLLWNVPTFDANTGFDRSTNIDKRAIEDSLSKKVIYSLVESSSYDHCNNKKQANMTKCEEFFC